MRLTVQRRLAGKLLNCSPKRVRFDPERLEEIKGAITSFDVQRLISDYAIGRIQAKGISRARANKIHSQKVKGRQKGPGSKKGRKTARTPSKQVWINKIRLQRTFLRTLKENGHINNQTFRALYIKSKGGFFRNKRHIKGYIEENNMVMKK
ncbi:50S ribosomal protein L19e [Candidatus Woesearchaeota archaeon]|nr:50S ribosomal protein L19e [Candidatus Woesearchaeota archaeon]